MATFCLYFVVSLVVCYAFQLDKATVKILQGKLKGRVEHTLLNNRKYFAYYGVPYALPPVGDLRFMPPKNPTKWKGTSDATTPSTKHCPQMDMYVEQTSSGDEDCLYLNVYTPQLKRHVKNESTKPLAVMFWIHGGGFVTGSGNMNLYGPDFFIEEDVVVITINYRLGVFGFLNFEDDYISGNMGLKDIVKALRWVRENIAVFGGNPNNVTIFGSEAGGTAVSLLLLSPMAKGLFARAICQSGASLSPKYFHSYSIDSISRLARYLRKDATYSKSFVRSLRNVNPLVISEASSLLYDSTESRNRQNIITAFAPTVEKVRYAKKKQFITMKPESVYEYDEITDVPFMVGYNSQESITQYRGIINSPELLNILNYNFQFLLPYKGLRFEYNSSKYKEASDKIKSFYFNNGTISANSLDDYIDYTTDRAVYPIHKMISLHLQNFEIPLYFYRFSFDGPFNIYKIATINNPTKTHGASNGDEICYLFKCDPIKQKYRNTTNEEGILMIRKMTRLWSNFAKYGNPTPKKENILNGLLWKAANEESLNCLEISKNIRMTVNPDEKRMKFWNQFYDEYSRNQTIANKIKYEF